jgi:NAD+ diphosphatase
VEEHVVTSASSVDFEPGLHAPDPLTGPTRCFAFSGDRILVHLENSGAVIPDLATVEGLGLSQDEPHYLGDSQRAHCFTLDLTDDAEPPVGMALKDLRQLFSLDEGSFVVAGRAFQILNWDRTHRFCGRCGAATHHHSKDRARQCPDCGLLSFPRVSPAIIVIIQKGDEFLLARNRSFPGKRYSIIAGFVEPGESLEETVVREVREEVGIEVKDVSYFSSQPWPFPHSLMVGFTAHHASGEIDIDGDEIVDAGWYRANNLPELPDGISISRHLIDWFLERHP